MDRELTQLRHRLVDPSSAREQRADDHLLAARMRKGDRDAWSLWFEIYGYALTVGPGNGGASE
jgi:hypothetical protein